MQANQGLKISEQTNVILNHIRDWCNTQGGVALIGDSVDEKLWTAFNTCQGVRCLIIFTGEEPYGSEDVRELTGRVVRHFDVAIYRGKYFSDPRNTTLTQTSGIIRPFFDQVEELIDIIRNIVYPKPFCSNPGIYDGVRPHEEQNWKMDGFIISFSVITQRARPELFAPELLPNNGLNGPFTDLNDYPFNNEGTPNSN